VSFIKSALKKSKYDKSILAIWLPSAASLLVYPLFYIVDTAIVGHLGTQQLAGLALGASLISAITEVFMFLGFATISAVSISLGLGDKKRAMRLGLDSIWLAVGIGIVIWTLLYFFTDEIINAFLSTTHEQSALEAGEYAYTYLKTISWKVPFVLISFACNGVLRGMQRVRFSTFVSIVMSGVNIVLNFYFVYGLDLGIKGSALGTLVAQVLGGIALLIAVMRHILHEKVGIMPSWSGFATTLSTGIPLFIRSLCLWATIVFLNAVSIYFGSVALAAMQVVESIWLFGLLTLDALAIAAQTLIAEAIGKKDEKRIQALVNRILQIALMTGIPLIFFQFIMGYFSMPMFTADPEVQFYGMLACFETGLIVMICAVTFPLDGVLMAGEDMKYLAKVAFFGAVPTVILVLIARIALPPEPWGIIIIWFIFDGVYIGIRAILNYRRVKSNVWYKHAIESVSN
jgi:putative MATE family efflux protein